MLISYPNYFQRLLHDVRLNPYKSCYQTLHCVLSEMLGAREMFGIFYRVFYLTVCYFCFDLREAVDATRFQ